MKIPKNIEYLKNQPLKNYTTFKIGGIAKHLFIAKSRKDLKNLVNICKESKKSFKIVGMGANLLFDSKKTSHVIILNRYENMRVVADSVFVSSGTNLNELISKCAEKGLTGLEDLTGIPATVGGAIYNNISAFNCEISKHIDYVIALDILNPEKILKIGMKDCQFGYRKSVFQSNKHIILGAKFSLKKRSPLKIKKDIAYAIKRKLSSQPLDKPSAGSVFKRGKIIPAKVIDELGLKGLKIGGAMISPKHAGFIINTGDASSKDVLDLMKLIEKRIFDTTNEKIEREIEYVKK